MQNKKQFTRNILSQSAFLMTNKALARQIGLTAAVFVADLISKEEYFDTHNMLQEDGFFFNTQEEIENSTTLSRFKQRKIIKELIKIDSSGNVDKDNIISIKKEGLPAKLHYKLNHGAIQSLILDVKSTCSQNEQVQVNKMNKLCAQSEQVHVHKVQVNNNKRNNNKLIRKKNNIVKAEQSSGSKIIIPEVIEKENETTNTLISSFQSINPSYARFFSNKTQRGALDRLVIIHGYSRIKNIVENILPVSNTLPFSPAIISPLELESKYGKLKLFYERQKVAKLVTPATKRSMIL